MIREFARLPGVPETALDPDGLAGLPDHAAPAPWWVRATALLWLDHRPDERARAALARVVPPALTDAAQLVAVLGGLIRYSSTPVGGYAEVVGIARPARPGGSKPPPVPGRSGCRSSPPS